MKTKYILAKSIVGNGIWFYERKDLMSNKIHKGIKQYKTYTNALVVVRKLNAGWGIIPITL